MSRPYGLCDVEQGLFPTTYEFITALYEEGVHWPAGAPRSNFKSVGEIDRLKFGRS